jgi:hypothetical protein
VGRLPVWSGYHHGCRGLLLVLGVASSAAAQAPVGTVTGLVTDSGGAPISGAEVAVVGISVRARTDDRGTFRLTKVRAGLASLEVRRLGFRPASSETVVQVGATTSVDLRLLPLARVLSPVVVKTQGVRYTGRLAGYYERLDRRSSGYFITREQIDRENPRFLTHLLQRAPGVTVVRGRTGLTSVRLRGRGCRPLIWLDGMPMPSADVDLDSFSPSTIHGVEIYRGATEAPARYHDLGGKSSCGAILLWSRGPDTELDPSFDLRQVSDGLGALETLIDGLAVYTADRVDTAAYLPAGQELDVSYPHSLLAAGTGGYVVAEFVVDTLGQAELETVGFVSFTHPILAQAVREALGRATYSPAVRNGRRVRQLVHQPVRFIPPASRRAHAARDGQL